MLFKFFSGGTKTHDKVVLLVNTLLCFSIVNNIHLHLKCLINIWAILFFRSKLQFESQKKTYSQTKFDFVNLTVHHLPTAWWLRWLPDDCMKTAWWTFTENIQFNHYDCPMTAWKLFYEWMATDLLMTADNQERLP